MITKAIFPVAGLGTRFLPATKANPKEMLPIIDKPLIQYAVEEAISAGITELIFVTSGNKRAIEDHFDSNFELEALLSQKGDLAKLDLVVHTIPDQVHCSYVRQRSPLGLGHAVLCAERLVGNEAFAVILADDLLIQTPENCLREMIAQHQHTKQSVICVQEIAPEESMKYGIITPSHSHEVHSDLIVLSGIVEKPHPDVAPSRLGVIGRYVFTPKIFEQLHQTGKGAIGEIQLTDAIASLLVKETVYAYRTQSTRYDCGSKIGYFEAMLAYGLTHPEIGEEARALIKQYARI